MSPFWSDQNPVSLSSPFGVGWAPALEHRALQAAADAGVYALPGLSCLLSDSMLPAAVRVAALSLTVLDSSHLQPVLHQTVTQEPK